MDFFVFSDKIACMENYDVIIIGAGAAGLSAAGQICTHGGKVLILEMGATPARKVMASGGGRCNITNTSANYQRYFGKNPQFVHSALTQVSPQNILDWAYKNKIKLIQKTPGRYFCADGAGKVVDALLNDARGADIFYNANITSIEKTDNQFIINRQFIADALIIATGGTSFPVLGVSDAGQKIAKQFGHKIIPLRPALCAIAIRDANSELAGISIPVKIKIGKNIISDDLLFTHFGIGGPAAYRASLYNLDNGFEINMLPDINLYEYLRNAKQTNGRKNLSTVLSELLPTRIAKSIAQNNINNIADIKDKTLQEIAQNVNHYYVSSDKIKLHGMQSAEVVRGGVDVNDISSKTMESKICSGLFFAGEVMDIAGDLGGFNLQWAWSSGRVAGINAVCKKSE
ncbi:MAG: aminoacetone oxidase family FAD-binding enzyme [Alphaproteobacteria bacterium]|nr:aminoacetone oxidase family FAD-binding enzyme [Alphaproteobacteria bacterium]